MRYAGVVALALVACTSPRAADPRPTSAPSPSVTPSADARGPLTYVSDLAPGARRTLVTDGAKAYWLDHAGRVTASRWLPAGGHTRLVRAATGRTYLVADDMDDGPTRLFEYAADGTFRAVASSDGWYPDRFGTTVYRDDDGALRSVVPRDARRWPLPVTSQIRSDVKGFQGLGDSGPDAGAPLLVVDAKTGPVVASAFLARCAVTSPGTGRQLMLDAEDPWQWTFCGAAAVTEDGWLGVLLREGGERDLGRDRLFLLKVDPVTLRVVERRFLRTLRPYGASVGTARLVALPGGLAAYVADDHRHNLVADLRGPKPVWHRVPNHGHDVAAAGPGSFYVWGTDGGEVVRVDVATGRVERDVLSGAPRYPTGIVRVR